MPEQNPNTQPSHAEMEEMLQKNAELLEENNQILKKIHRNAMWGIWLRVIWYLLLLGLPFALYFYVVEPYFEALGSNYEVFKAGINEIPGLKGLGSLMEEMMGR